MKMESGSSDQMQMEVERLQMRIYINNSLQQRLLRFNQFELVNKLTKQMLKHQPLKYIP
jgi:predicted DNA binding CopG/RHH family protein